MICSMTGFGRAEDGDDSYRIIVEMRSVNNRYLDLNIRMPKKFNAFENRIRGVITSRIERGKMDVFITYETFDESGSSLRCNEELAADYVAQVNALSQKLGVEGHLKPADLLRIPDVFKMEEVSADEEALWQRIEAPLNRAIDAFVEARKTEGERLKDDLIAKLDGMAVCAREIEEREPQILEEYRARLTAKLHEILDNPVIDESRLAAEVVLYADKISTDEETVRLRSHIEATKTALQKGGAVGRKLDFLAQEMNREANTILSKANDLQTSDLGIALKTDIEKVREQIQNIE